MNRMIASLLLLSALVLAQAATGAPGEHDAFQVLNTLGVRAHPLEIAAHFELQDIIAIDDEAEAFEFSGVLTLSWKDPRQAFDPAVAGVAEKQFIGDYQFNEIYTGWWPQITLLNNAGKLESHGVLLRIRPDGTLLLAQSVNAITKTNLNVRMVPFDTQRLEARFHVLGHDASEVVLVASGSEGEEPADLDANYTTPQWHVLGVAQRGEAFEALQAGEPRRVASYVFAVDLERKPLFYVRLVILPMILIVLMSWSIFWMDKSSLGDRINVSLIGILTSVAFQMSLDESLPQSSYMTLMNGFLSVSFVLMFFGVLQNLRVSFLDRQGRTAEGDLLDQHCRWLFPLVYAVILVLLPIVMTLLPPPK